MLAATQSQNLHQLDPHNPSRSLHIPHARSRFPSLGNPSRRLLLPRLSRTRCTIGLGIYRQSRLPDLHFYCYREQYPDLQIHRSSATSTRENCYVRVSRSGIADWDIESCPPCYLQKQDSIAVHERPGSDEADAEHAAYLRGIPSLRRFGIIM